MQSKKDLAEAGRRKLEEFRKAKAAGKAAPATSKTASADEQPAAPAQGSPLGANGSYSQGQPPAPLSGSSSTANGIAPNGTSANGNGHAPWASSVPTPAPTPAWGQVGATYSTGGSAAVPANAGISVTGYSAPYPQQKQPAPAVPEANGYHPAREPAVPAGQAPTSWPPSAPHTAGAQGPTAPNGDPSPSKVSPTSFVVLEHAPIPFGSPGYKPPSQPGSAAVGGAAAAPQAEDSMRGTGGGIPWLPAKPTPFPLEVAAPPPAPPVSGPPVSTFWQPQPPEPLANPPPAPQPDHQGAQFGNSAYSTGGSATVTAPAIPFGGPSTGGAPDASAEFDAALGLSPLAPAQGSGTHVVPVFANAQPSTSAVTAIGSAGNADAPWALGRQSRSGSETGAAGGAASSHTSTAATTELNTPAPWGVTGAAEAQPAAPAPWRPEPAPAAPSPPPVMPSVPGAESFGAGSSVLHPPLTTAHPYYAAVGLHAATEVQDASAPPSSSPKASFWSWGHGGGTEAVPPPASQPNIPWLPQPAPFTDGRSAQTEAVPNAAEANAPGQHDNVAVQSSGAGKVGGHGHNEAGAELQAASEQSMGSGSGAPGGYSASYGLPQGPAAAVQLPNAHGHAPYAAGQRWQGEQLGGDHAASSSQGAGAGLGLPATGRGASEADNAPAIAAGAASQDDMCGYGLLADMYLAPGAAAAPAANPSTATAAAPSASPMGPAVSSSSGGGVGGGSSGPPTDDGPGRETSSGGAPSNALPVSFGGALEGPPVPTGPATETSWQPPAEPARPPSPPPAAPASPAAPSPAPSRFSWLFGGGKTPSKDKPAQQAAQPPNGPPSRPRSLDQQLAAAGPQEPPQQVATAVDARSWGAMPQVVVASDGPGVGGVGYGAEGSVPASETPVPSSRGADGLFADSDGTLLLGTHQQQLAEEAPAASQPPDSLPTHMSLGVWGPAGSGPADAVSAAHSAAGTVPESGHTGSAPLWSSGLGASSNGGSAVGVAAAGVSASANRQDFGSSSGYMPSYLRGEAAAVGNTVPAPLPATGALAPLPWERDRTEPASTGPVTSGMPSFGGMVPDVASASTEPPRVDASSAATRYPHEPLSSAPQPTGLPPLPPTSAAASATTPRFLAAASYLSAYSASSTPPTSSSALTLPPPTSTYAPPPPLSGATGTTSTLGTSTLPSAAGAGAPASTSSFLESYLDNLLSTMSNAKDSHGPATDGAKQPHGGPVTAENSMHGTMGVSGSASRRTSHTGDGDSEHPAPSAAGDADLGAGAGSTAHHGHKQSAGAVGGEHAAVGGVRSHPTSHHGGHGVGGVPHVDSSLHLPHHSRQQSVDSMDASVLSHATGTVHSAMPGGAHSTAGRAQFTALQQHIDELTEEKLQLARGLQQQTRINEQLSEENGELMRQYNARGTMVEELQRKIKQYEQELEAQALSLEGFSSDRQAAMSSYQEATSRAQALAAEVVGLEAQVLQLKSAVLKAERAAEEAQKRAAKLEKQVATLSAEAAERANELQQTQLKGRNLVVKLKQTESKLREAEEKLEEHAAAAGPGAPPARGFLGRGRHAAAAAPKVETAELEVQCTLGDELAAEAAAAAAAAAEMERLAAEVAAEAAREAAAEAAVEAAAAGLPPRAFSEGARPSGSGEGESLQLVEWAGPQRPLRDPPSAVLAEQAMSSIDTRALRRAGAASAGAGALPEGVDAVAAALSRWLPAGPVGGSNPVALIAEEEVRLIESIHDMLGNFEQAQAEAHAEIERLEARIVSLSAENSDLRHKLELQTQRLELELQGSKLAVSLHHTPVSHGLEPGAPASASTFNLDAAGDVATPSGQQGLGKSHGSMQQQQQQQSHSAGPAINNAHVFADAAATPTRSAPTSVRRPPLMSLDDPADAVQSPPQRQGWMGYLFRPRQKKRVRSAVL